MKKILIVEDDPFLAEMYVSKLSKESDFRIDSATDGEMALQKIKEMMPDLIILDLVLPKINGFEVLKTVKNDQTFKNIKILLLSGLGEEEDVRKGLRLGADAYLIKSHFTPTEVVEKVKELLANSQ